MTAPTNQRSIWVDEDNPKQINIIDQRFLPHERHVEALTRLEDAATAIHDMHVRGAPLIGVTAAYGIYLKAVKLENFGGTQYKGAIEAAAEWLKDLRPSAVNLARAVDLQLALLEKTNSLEEFRERSFELANQLAEEDVASCQAIGEHGADLLAFVAQSKEDGVVNVLTHCNAGWLATIEYGTALAPIYVAHDRGVKVHVWVDETRPRLQGANLTAWELAEREIPHTVITDNAGGHLMQHHLVDLVLVGTDRTTPRGDVMNKIGTYQKALAAQDNSVPFYVALPELSVDWEASEDPFSLPVEERDPNEIHWVHGTSPAGHLSAVRITPEGSKATNVGFDVTPARLVTGFITPNGFCGALEDEIRHVFEQPTEKVPKP